MNSIKSAAVLGIVAAMGVALFMKMNGGPEPEPPEEFSGAWGPPAVEMSPPEAGFPGGPVGAADAVAGMRGEYRSAPAPFASADREAVPPESPGDPYTGAMGRPSAAERAGLPGREAEVPGGSQSGPFSGDVGSRGTNAESNGPAAPGYGSEGPRAPVWADAREEPVTDGVATEAPSAAGAPPTDPVFSAPDVDPTATSPAGSGQALDGQPPTAAGLGGSPFALARSSAEEILERGDLAQAHLLLSRWYDDPSLTEAERGELVNLLGQLAGTVIYSTEHHLEPAYQVQPGETLEVIAEKFRVPWQLLARINGLDSPEQVQQVGSIKVVRGPFSAWISLSRREMVLVVGGYYAGRFRVGVGSERTDMEGQWIVRHKAVNPTYYGRDRVIDGEDPGNPLGEYWLGLGGAQEDGTVSPLGIHGTYDAASLDRDDPRGYIRLAPEDIRDVYDILSVGSRVTIRQ